jgi:uncharacterized membrane protein YtjA (UPF0391 family)
MSHSQEFGDGGAPILRPDRMLVLRRHMERMPVRLYRNTSGQWLTRKTGVSATLYWAAAFFVVAIVAAVLGFGGIAAGAAGIAKILFMVFIVLFAISILVGVVRPGRAGKL